MAETLYAGFFVSGGRLRECCVYPSRDCARDTMLDHFKRLAETAAVSDYGVAEVNTDGSWRVVE